jgi:hypothetical protein
MWSTPRGAISMVHVVMYNIRWNSNESGAETGKIDEFWYHPVIIGRLC